MRTCRVLRSSRRPDAMPTPTPAAPKQKPVSKLKSETPARARKLIESPKCIANNPKSPDLPDISSLVITTSKSSKSAVRKGRPRKTPDAAENLKIVKKKGRPRKTPEPTKITIEVPTKLAEKLFEIGETPVKMKKQGPKTPKKLPVKRSMEDSPSTYSPEKEKTAVKISTESFYGRKSSPLKNIIVRKSELVKVPKTTDTKVTESPKSVKTPKSPKKLKSPVKSRLKSPVKSPLKSPVRSTVKSTVKTPQTVKPNLVCEVCGARYVKLGFFKAHLKKKHEKFYKHYVGEPDIGNVEPLKLQMSPAVVIPESERVTKTPEMLEILRKIDSEAFDEADVKADDTMNDTDVNLDDSPDVDKSEISENDKKLLGESEIRNVSWPQFFVRMQPGFLRRIFQNSQ